LLKLRALDPLPPPLKALLRDGLGLARLTEGLALGLGLLTEGDAAGLLTEGDALGRAVGVAPVLGRAAPSPVPVEGRAPIDGVPVLGRLPPEPQPRASMVPADAAAPGEPLLLRRLWSGCHFFGAEVFDARASPRPEAVSRFRSPASRFRSRFRSVSRSMLISLLILMLSPPR